MIESGGVILRVQIDNAHKAFHMGLGMEQGMNKRQQFLFLLLFILPFNSCLN